MALAALERDRFDERREALVTHTLVARGIRSQLVLGAMRSVPREPFLPPEMAEFAYEDNRLPIATGQTISQPYIVALMVEALELRGGERVLEIGTGSGYAAAVLARIAKDVYTVERVGQLAEKAASALARLGIANVHVRHADGTHGWADRAPYDAIVVAAGGPAVPEALKRQLRIGGRLVMPVGTDLHVQELVRVTRPSYDEYKSERPRRRFGNLFTGRYPRPLFEFVVRVFRWWLRVVNDALLLTTDVYPPFSLRTLGRRRG